MRKDREKFTARVASALGANRVVPLSGLPSAGPIDLLQLRADVARRLRSTGGRPTDPAWNVQRLVPFRGQDWKRLEELASRLSTDERSLSAGQLAALLIERAIEGVDATARRR
jgi:hypothetical protein